MSETPQKQSRLPQALLVVGERTEMQDFLLEQREMYAATGHVCHSVGERTKLSNSVSAA